LALSLLGCLCPLPGWGEAEETPQRSTAAAEVALTHGILAFQEGDYQRARDLLEEAVERAPDEGTALHWLGLTYLKLGDAPKAVDCLKGSLKARHPPAAGKRRVRVDLGLIETAIATGSSLPAIEAPEEGAILRDPLAPPIWYVQTELGLGADSNPGLLPETATGLPLFGDGPRTAEADSAAQLDLRLELVPFFDRGGWSLGTSLAASRSVHRDFEDLDLTLIQAYVSLVYGGDPRGYASGPLGNVQVPRSASRYSVLLQGGGFDLRLGDNDYLQAGEAAGSFLVRETPRTATQFDVVARNRSFQREGPEPHLRSGEEIFLEVSQYVYPGRPDRHLRSGVFAGERGGGRDFESSFRGLIAELAMPLSDSWILHLTGNWRHESFAHSESRLGASGPARDDKYWTIEVTAVRWWNDHLGWTTSGSYFRNDSNLELSVGGPLFDYRRTLVSTGFIWTFQ
jgi:tetratricopeptide (TPR) repeat protein